jgi:hypothetical protein
VFNVQHQTEKAVVPLWTPNQVILPYHTPFNATSSTLARPVVLCPVVGTIYTGEFCIHDMTSYILRPKQDLLDAVEKCLRHSKVMCRQQDMRGHLVLCGGEVVDGGRRVRLDDAGIEGKFNGVGGRKRASRSRDRK